VTPPGTSQGAFLNCKVNGFECHALLDTGAEATIISEVVCNFVKSPLCKLQPQHKPVLGANNMPVDVLGEVEITFQLGSVTAQHRVFVCRGLTQEILVGIRGISRRSLDLPCIWATAYLHLRLFLE